MQILIPGTKTGITMLFLVCFSAVTLIFSTYREMKSCEIKKYEKLIKKIEEKIDYENALVLKEKVE